MRCFFLNQMKYPTTQASSWLGIVVDNLLIWMSLYFLFDGRRLRLEQTTPYELEIEDGDEIDAMLHQTGGSA